MKTRYFEIGQGSQNFSPSKRQITNSILFSQHPNTVMDLEINKIISGTRGINFEVPIFKDIDVSIPF